MPSPLIHLTEGSRIFASSWKQRLFPKKYSGNAREICQQAVKDCWNGRYFQVSPGNFSQFWTRDFGWCTQSLIKLGYQKEVHQTLRYALHRFKQQGKVTTTLTPRGKPYDFPYPAVDSLPWLIHSLVAAKAPVHEHRLFLQQQVKQFIIQFIDLHTGLVKPSLSVSSIKDLAIRKSSCYDNCLVALLAQHLKGLKIETPLQGYDYPSLLLRHFWNGSYFYDDLQQKAYAAGDANLFPFLFRLCTQEMFRSSLKALQEQGLDTPFPLKYTAGRAEVKFIPQELLLRNYERDSVWTHLGPLFIKAVQKVNPDLAKHYQQQYAGWIEREGNYLEVFHPSGKPFHTPFYASDRGMLWAANFLTL